ncbi:MAG: hypothetical protein FKY71_10565 [Spiribacter salinus]|uniref:Terminase n=1 Tax=Spiribacter salinus TaxID=1335746 RepID=A0A540VSD9_9GAMM|nr:MAG: hypothetical protein FKY71_10565 [Spiribacter salinus]
MSVDIRQAMTDTALFGETFGGPSWAAWRALLAGFYGLELDEAEAEHWKGLTSRESAPQVTHEELWLVVGRRGGKSQCAALLAIYEACFRDHRPNLAHGERATVLVLAADRRQARVVFRYITGMFQANPMLRRMIEREDRESLELSNLATIEVGTASFRTVRGHSLAAVVCDEVAYWRSEDSANPDSEIVAALRPAMATLGGKLVALSSPYSRRGELWDTYRRHYGQESPVLVAQAASRTMNPELPARVVQDAYERDPTAAAAEYGAEFRGDVSTFLDHDVVEAAARPDPVELPPVRHHSYAAFVDPAGGGADEFCLSIGHTEGERVVVDLVRARRGPPAAIVEEFVALLRAYGIRSVTGDRYGGQWPCDEFGRHGIGFEFTTRSKSELYVDSLAILNSGRLELPPDNRTLTQLANLERRTSRSGRDSVDHPPNSHDDRANAVAGLAAVAGKRRIEARSVPVAGLI